MPDKRETEEARNEQARRADVERELAEHAPEPAERNAHERRADKATYLREKLEEQARAPDKPDE